MSSLSIINGNNTLIVSFASYFLKMGGMPQFEFVNFLKTIPNTDQIFYKDTKYMLYHHGIDGISNTIEETVEYLKNVISHYKTVLFIGASGGGYAAILFGSLLHVTSVLAFFPPTLLNKNDKYSKYRDLSQVINSTTQYHVYGMLCITEPKDYHHISQCENIDRFSNVILIKRNIIILKLLRDSGELLQIILGILRKLPSRVSLKDFIP